jgi:NAD+ synthase
MQTDKVIEYIVHWLRQRCREAGLEGFVVGVSGGIDSAVTSTLCAKTDMPVLALNMPIHQAAEQISLSQQHIDWLVERFPHAQGQAVDLTPAFQALSASLPQEIQDNLTMANARSRLRMITLYAFANHQRRLVVGTGNKVEDFGVGFYTKYGDGGVDLAPIADLMKSEVYALGRELCVSDTILRAPPTDGLWQDNRSDEDQLGASYDDLEWAMRFENGETGQSEKDLSQRQQEVLALYRRLHRANRHKMVPIPVAEIPDELR